MYNVSTFRDTARSTVDFLVRNLAGSLPPGLSLISVQGTDLAIREKGSETIPCMDLALVDLPESAEEYAGLVHVALDSIQTVVSRVTTGPWPTVAGAVRVVNAYSAVQGETVTCGYGTIDNPLLALPPLRLPETFGRDAR